MVEGFKVATSGRYCLTGGDDVQCLADVSATDAVEIRRLSVGPLPKSGTRVACYLDNIGLMDGIVLYGRPSGFAFQIVANPERLSRIEARLAWLRTADTRNDQRKAARIIPVNREVKVHLLGAPLTEALIADVSMTGAALLMDERPQVGATVTVGKRYATVVRHTAEGIGVAFRLPFGSLTFNERVVL
jgi:hypothetical protein